MALSGEHATLLRKRIAPLILIVGAVLFYLVAKPSIPHSNDVALDFGEAARDVVGVEMVWTQANEANAEEPLIRTHWNFEKGTAPTQLHSSVRLATGRWRANVEVERAGRSERTRWSRKVYLEGTQVVLPLREALR